MRRSKLIVPNHISILTVDDDPIITDTIQDYFRRSGYIVDAETTPVLLLNGCETATMTFSCWTF